MYIPPYFAENQPEQLQRIIHDHPLGILVTQGAQGLDANHLPFEFDASHGEHGLLTAHVARANPVWQTTAEATPVMVIFRGVDAYISPNWYPSKHEAHRQVPTWNYEVVHVHGVMRVMDDEKFVRRVVAMLTKRHEAGEPIPWKMGDAPREFLDDMLSKIVGIEIVATRIEGKRKLSQNKDERDKLSTIAHLRERGHEDIAAAMQQASGL